jgi:hypothetical protein
MIVITKIIIIIQADMQGLLSCDILLFTVYYRGGCALAAKIATSQVQQGGLVIVSELIAKSIR